MRTVRRSLLVLMVIGVLMMSLVGLVGTLAAVRASDAADHLVDELAPASTSLSDTHLQVVSASASVRAYAISGDPVEREAFRRAVDQIPERSKKIRAYVQTRPELKRLFDAFEQSAQDWIEGYGEPRVLREGGPGTFSRSQYVEGAGLFRDFEIRFVDLEQALDERYSDLREGVNERARNAVLAIVVTAVAGGLLLLLLGWLVSRSIQNPLEALGDTVRRLRSGDTAARTPLGGPREISRVSALVNDLADENDRARQMEAEVRRGLREMDTAKTDFVSNVSHELRTPLTIINGYLELLSDDGEGELNESQRGMLDVAQRNVKRLRELIEDLLLLNNAEQSGTVTRLIDLADVVGEVITDVRMASTNKAVTLRTKLADDPVPVLGDSSQLHRAILNVVGNAVKFSPEGADVEVELRSEGDDAVVIVRDHGMGIPAADLDKLGARFFRASNAVRSKVPGTGLGFRIVQTIMANHHGSVSVESEEQVGTTVTLTLTKASDEALREVGGTT